MSVTDFWPLLWWLICGHALADYALQSDWMAKHKHHKIAPTFQAGTITWPYVLGAHALIHGMMVGYFTGSVVLGVAETAAHAAIDYGKCDGFFGIHEDQAAHLLCKVLWAIIALW